jgi:PST family polysaccharide transporter
MIFAVISQKVLAIIIGPEGIALVGNFKNVINFFEQFSVFGTFNGLVKYISEFKNNKDELNHLFSTAMIFALVSGIISFLILFFGSNLLNEYIFGTENNYSYIFKILAFVIPFMGINSILNGLLNGLSEYKIFTKAMITTVVIGTILIVFFTLEYNIKGSLLAICLFPIVNFIAFTIFYNKQFAKDFSFLKLSFSLFYGNKLLSYSLMTLIVILLINMGDIIVRNLIQETINTREAGHWTAMTSISKLYMQFTLAIFPLYILPKYSEITRTVEFRMEIVNIYKGLVPLFLLGIILIYLLKNTIISILYTDDFLKMSNLFKWQLLGDLVKLCSLIISYQFLAKKKIGYFLLTETLSVFLFVGFSEYFIQFYGTEGIVLAHFVRYLIYFLVVAFILRHKLTGKDKIL